MIDPPRIANLLSAGQHNLNYFVVRKRRNKEEIKKKYMMASLNDGKQTNILLS